MQSHCILLLMIAAVTFYGKPMQNTDSELQQSTGPFQFSWHCRHFNVTCYGHCTNNNKKQQQQIFTHFSLVVKWTAIFFFTILFLCILIFQACLVLLFRSCGCWTDRQCMTNCGEFFFLLVTSVHNLWKRCSAVCFFKKYFSVLKKNILIQIAY